VLEEAFQVKPGLVKEMHHDHVYTLRLIKYPTGVQEAQDRAGTHTDFTTISFVVSDRRGLEVEDRQGGWRWIDPEPGCITCNFGDMIRFLIPDIRSTPHRVRGDGDAAQTERYTAALFFHCDPDRHLNLDGTEAGPTSREFLQNKHLETQKPTVVS
jgi:isopenicillin N synthase-like dioxygenase